MIVFVMKNLLILVILVIIFGIQFTFFSLKPFTPLIWFLFIIYLYNKNYLYLAINSYILLLVLFFAEILNFDTIAFRYEMGYSSLIILLTFMFIFFNQELPKKYSRIITIGSIIITLMIYIVPIVYIIYAFNFNTKITKDIIYAISQTNLQESFEFIKSSISLYWILLLAFIIPIISILLVKQEKEEKTKIEQLLLIFLLVYLFSNLLIYRNNIHLISFLNNATKEYKKELQLFRDEQEKMKTGDIKFDANKINKAETYIVIIGESLNKHHMGIYGYKRSTTPLLQKSLNTYLKFENAYSNHTHTMPVLSLALTEANQLNNYTFYNSLSIIDILKKADFESYWISNQNMYGAWDNLVSIIAHQANHLVSINHSSGKTTRMQKFDEEVLFPIKKILRQPNNKKNRVIFVHLMGNHIDYCLRYPSNKFTQFTNDAPWNSLKSTIDCYDNSIIYNDYVVNSIMEILKTSDGIRGLIYMSDHADDVDNDLGHNSSSFTYSMTQIPLIMWFSNSYKQKYPLVYNNLVHNQKKLFSNDLFYDSLLGIMQVKTKHYNNKYDLSSENYELNDSEAFTLHGKVKYVDKDNQFYSPTK